MLEEVAFSSTETDPNLYHLIDLSGLLVINTLLLYILYLSGLLVCSPCHLFYM